MSSRILEVSDKPGKRCIALTPSDTQTIAQQTVTPPAGHTYAAGVGAIPYARGIEVSDDCTLKITTLGGDTRAKNFKAAAGIYPICILQIWDTGSDAGIDIDGYY